ncbi:GAF and ANTAR domain-containing protein [Nocardioides sp.]|uniref:GAF and ANTAR domain-containing protein n=1 Tax=Nocardioides sp. TaxID=35761 RepID=UPI0026134891|nr:GAF and ANTAR domain-containing protein [Nocardioides sp.]
MSDTQRSLRVDATLLVCLLRDFDDASITVVDDAGAVASWARVGDLASPLDHLQHDAGEGPCLDALRDGRLVLAPRIRHDGRWPAYVAAGVGIGLRSQLAMPVRWRDDMLLGALNLYSTTHDDIDASAPVVAGVVAGQVGRSLASFREIEALDRALAERTVIGQACGLVMGRLDLDPDHAFEHLRRRAAAQGRALVLVAQEMVLTSDPRPG